MRTERPVGEVAVDEMFAGLHQDNAAWFVTGVIDATGYGA